MATYTRRIHIRASLESVWDFHATTAGLEAITPGWMGLTVESVSGTEGTAESDQLTSGSRIRMRARPFGRAPTQRWTSVITDRQRSENQASFTDEMVGGPFPEWRHTHLFRSVAGGTLMTDHVEYSFPGGRLGHLLSPLGNLGLAPMFTYRHAKTRELLEPTPNEE